MAQIIQKISVEVSKPNFFQAIVAKQYDNNSRFLKVTLLHEGNKIEVEPNSTVTINAKRNDGKSSAFKGKVNDDGTVTVPVNFWMLELIGTLVCDVSVIGPDESKLTTSKFIVEVEEASCTNGDISTEIITSIVTVVPPEKGGTGVETLKDARYAMNFIGANPLTQNSKEDTPSAWLSFGKGYAYLGKNDRTIMNIPLLTTDCYIHSYIYGSTIYQSIYPLSANGTIFHRSGNTNGWFNNGDWQIEATRKWTTEQLANKADKKKPTLTKSQKDALVSLMDEYFRVRNSLFFFTGAIRRQGYANAAPTHGEGNRTYGVSSKYGFNTPEYCVLKHTNPAIDDDNPTQEYYKYMLNCAVFCQMIWMGRPIEAFLQGDTLEEKKLLAYAKGTSMSNKTDALKNPPVVTKEIMSNFPEWAYYFDFALSKKAYGAKINNNAYYTYNSYKPESDITSDLMLNDRLPIGFDGGAPMAEELYRMGCEIPREEMDVGDLVFYCAEDLRDDESVLENRSFRNITHVGIVYSMTNGEPMIMDCTNSYDNESVMGKTSLNSKELFARVKAAYQHNQTVMVARHPAAFGFGGNLPESGKFEQYRGVDA